MILSEDGTGREGGCFFYYYYQPIISIPPLIRWEYNLFYNVLTRVSFVPLLTGSVASLGSFDTTLYEFGFKLVPGNTFWWVKF